MIRYLTSYMQDRNFEQFELFFYIPSLQATSDHTSMLSHAHRAAMKCLKTLILVRSGVCLQTVAYILQREAVTKLQRTKGLQSAA